MIAQVKRLSETQLPTQDVHVPGILVDAVVVAPDQMQTTQTVYDPALSGEIHRDLRRHRAGRVRSGEGHRPPRRAGAAGQRHRQSRLRDLRRLPAGAARGGPRRRRHLGYRTGRGRRLPADRVRVRMRPEPGGLLQSVDQFTLLAGRRFRRAMLSFLEVVREPAMSTSPTCRRGRTSPPASAASTTSSPARRRSSSPATSLPARRTSRSPTASSRSSPTVDRQVRPRCRPDLFLRRDGPQSAAKRSSTSPSAASSSCEDGTDCDRDRARSRP